MVTKVCSNKKVFLFKDHFLFLFLERFIRAQDVVVVVDAAAGDDGDFIFN